MCVGEGMGGSEGRRRGYRQQRIYPSKLVSSHEGSCRRDVSVNVPEFESAKFHESRQSPYCEEVCVVVCESRRRGLASGGLG